MTPEERKRLDDLEDWRLTMEGPPPGNNGRLSVQRARVDLLYKVAAGIASAALAALVTGALALYRSGESEGREAAERQYLREQVDQHRRDISRLESALIRGRAGLPPVLEFSP